MASITFFGGAGAVTGSKYLLEVADTRILLDCGMFQGLSDVRERNRSFPFPPDSINHVVLSHAHIDHCGMLPLLVKRGFTGNIFATPATRDVAEHMLLDMAGIEEQDTEYRAKHHVGSPDEREPLITREDIPLVMERFVEVEYSRDGVDWQEIAPGVRIKMYDAGHILGSAISVLEITEGDKIQRIAYSGDIGPKGMPLLHDLETPEEEIDTLLLESTYGAREHKPLEYALERFADAVQVVSKRGGKMIVPAFSLGRTQILVYAIHKLTDEERIPRFPIYVDSPLATTLTDVHRKYPGYYDAETGEDFTGQDHGPLSFRNLTYVQSVMESKALNFADGPFMVISASGMMTAGRVVHHLRHTISDARNAVFVTGYQAEGTVGRRIIEGAKTIELYGDMFDVKAQLFLFNEFSAHADRKQLIEFASSIKGLKRIALVHGEAAQADILKEDMARSNPHWDVLRPKEGYRLEL